MDRQPVHLLKSQVKKSSVFSQIPSAVQPVDYVPHVILKCIHYLTQRCTSAYHTDDQKQLGGKCRAQQKHPSFFHCVLSFDGVYILLSVYYNDPVGQPACPSMQDVFAISAFPSKLQRKKPPRLPLRKPGRFVCFICAFSSAHAITCGGS